MSRISTLSSNNELIKLMLKTQSRLQDQQVQVATEKNSQDYTGIAKDSERLISIETTRAVLDNFSSTNALMDMRLTVTGTALDGIDDALSEFRKDLIKFEATSMTGVLEVRDIQNVAFTTLQTMEAFLNTDVNGQFLFSGGRATTQPVDLGLTTLSDLQTKWDGANVTYPTYRDNSIHPKLTATTGYPSNPAAGFTALNFTAGAGGTIATTNVTAQVDTVTIGGTVEAGDKYTATINGTLVTYTVTGAEANLDAIRDNFFAAINTAALGVTAAAGGAGQLTLTADTAGTAFTATVAPINGGVTSDNTATIATTTANANAFANIPVGSTITISGADTTANNGTYTVASNSGGVITVGATETITTTVTPDANVAGDTLTMTNNMSYYQGDEVTQTHSVNKSRSFNVDLNGVDPAIEKAIRGLFIIAQGQFQTAGGLDQNTSRVSDIRYLMDSALQRNPGGTPPYGTELTSSLDQVTMNIGFDRVLIDQTNALNKSLVAFYDQKVADFEDIDPLAVYTKMLDEQTALEASYSAMARIRQLSLLNFMN
ncbi:MAG: hypothetical protein HOL66_14880 [Rhodospirillaceae bacterium]|jgi:flagellar hook-associated protein 3 FlgL|nr:hypothetical protein [Rhodospirillaceae bacterium]MBT5245520.1 hypothetical protein [Rhodospirillaceae bacterium]MBT6240638.1 hypothetical protein [Rhodospirillaceae bacterium]